MIKAVFLDIDNTLLSFSGYVKEAMRDGFAQFGLKPYTEDMFEVFEGINTGLWQQLERGELSFEGLMAVRWQRIFAALDIDFDGPTFEQYFREKLFVSAVPMPHAKELLEYLHGRYVLCVASNGPLEQQRNRLRIADMARYFSHVFVSGDLGVQKPEREFFVRCFDRLRAAELPELQPEETIIIGDSLSSDMAGGLAFGMHTCLYHPGGVPDNCPAEIGHIVTDLSEIRQFL